MLTYNTQLKQLILPEYGRNIQKMIDLCLTIEDREERNACAHAIINAMGNLFPALRETEESRNKLWDHLAIMSDFNLDIDYPCNVIQRETLDTIPETIPYVSPINGRRHYGRHILSMIQRAAEMPEGEERDALVYLLANQMKKTALIEGENDSYDDIRVFADIAALTHGQIRLDPENCRLCDFDIVRPASKKKKKK